MASSYRWRRAATIIPRPLKPLLLLSWVISMGVDVAVCSEAETLSALLVQRSPRASFMPSASVFPGPQLHPSSPPFAAVIWTFAGGEVEAEDANPAWLKLPFPRDFMDAIGKLAASPNRPPIFQQFGFVYHIESCRQKPFMTRHCMRRTTARVSRRAQQRRAWTRQKVQLRGTADPRACNQDKGGTQEGGAGCQS